MLASTERGALGSAVSYSLGISLLSLAVPIAAQGLVNTVAFGTMLQPLVVLTSLVAAGLVFAAVLRALQNVALEYFQQRLFVRVVLDVTERLTHQPAQASGRPTAEAMNRFFDVMTLQKGVATLAVDGVLLLLQLAFSMVLLAFYHPWLLVFDLGLILGVVVVLFPLGHSGTETAIKESKAKYAVAAWLEEMASHRTIFQGPGGAFARDRLRERTAAYVHARQKHFKVLLRQWVGGLALSVVASVALLGVGGWLVMNKQLTLGQLVAAELIVSAAAVSLVKVGKYLETLYDVLAAADKVGQLLELPVEPKRAHTLPPNGPLPLCFQGVTVPGGLSGVSFSVVPGGAAFLTGSEQACRAAMDVAFGNLAPAAGHVEVGDVDIRAVDRTDFHTVVMLLRDNELFTGTLLENLLVGERRVFEQVREALKASGAWQSVMALPDGVETVIGTGAPLLAPSLRGQLLLARAILHQPRLLLVDLPVLENGAIEAVVRRGSACTTIIATRTAPAGQQTINLAGAA